MRTALVPASTWGLGIVLALALGGLTPVAAQDTTSTDLTGVAPLPLSGDRRAAFESYIGTTLAMMGVPGASVAVVQGGEVVYLEGFGVKELGGANPVTPDTLMRLASATKPVTTTMTAALVDDGRLGWDTPVVDLLPDFAVADPELTRRLTVADLFCACSGVPTRDAELGFNAFELTPERLIASVADAAADCPLRREVPVQQSDVQHRRLRGGRGRGRRAKRPIRRLHAGDARAGARPDRHAALDLLAGGRAGRRRLRRIAPRQSGRRASPAGAARGPKRLHGGGAGGGALVERAGDGPLHPDPACRRRRP